MTVILTLVGFVVFVISCFTATFKEAFKRQLMFTGTGFVIDVLLGTLAFASMYVIHN